MTHGIVEIDETYIGGKSKRRFGRAKTKPRAEKFDMVMGLRERKGRVKFVHIPDGKAETIRKASQACSSAHSGCLHRFERQSMTSRSTSDSSKRHRTVNHSMQWIVPGTNIHTNTVESAFSLLKRGLIGSFHRVSIKHLHRYLSEFEFRFNVRKAEDRFSETLRRMLWHSADALCGAYCGAEGLGIIGAGLPGLPFIAEVFSGFCWSIRRSSASNCSFLTFTLLDYLTLP